MLAAADIAYPLRKIAAEYRRLRGASAARCASIDPAREAVTTVTRRDTTTGDYLVLAAGSQPNFFKTPGAEHAFPLYSLDDATRLADADHPGRSRRPTAIAELHRRGRARLRHRRRRSDGRRGRRRAVRDDQHDDGPRVPDARRREAKVHLVDHGQALLKMFADKAHAYTAGVLEKDGVDLRLGTGVDRDRRRAT